MPSGLAEPAFRPLSLGSVIPGGWLERQLRLQANGLTGHLDEFWPDVGQSQWFGGKAEGWDARLLAGRRDPAGLGARGSALQAKVKRRVDPIVATQRADGWYAPYPADASAKAYDVWSILLANKALVQYHEATGEAAVLEAVKRNLRAMLGRWTARRFSAGASSAGSRDWFRCFTCTSAPVNPGCSTSPASSRQGFDYRSSTRATMRPARHRAAACGPGRSTWSTPAWP